MRARIDAKVDIWVSFRLLQTVVVEMLPDVVLVMK